MFARCFAFLSDVKWTGGRVAVRSRIPRDRFKSMFIVLNFDVNTNIVYAIVRLLRCSVPKQIVFVDVFFI